MGKNSVNKPVLLIFAALLFAPPILSPAAEALLMDTFTEIVIKDNLPERGALESDTARLMKELEKKFNYHDPASEISLINRHSPGKKTAVSQEAYELLLLAKKMSEETSGAFDIARGRGGWFIDENTHEVWRVSGGIRLDPGGIAKGFIVDKGIAFLKENGVKNAMINAGGDMYCLGDSKTEGKGWRIGIRDPFKAKGVSADFAVRNKGVATSGDYERPGHIIDPATQAPARSGAISVTVVSENCARSDALSTALYVLGPEKGISLIEHIGGAEAYIVAEDGKAHASSGFRADNEKQKKNSAG